VLLSSYFLTLFFPKQNRPVEHELLVAFYTYLFGFSLPISGFKCLFCQLSILLSHVWSLTYFSLWLISHFASPLKQMTSDRCSVPRHSHSKNLFCEIYLAVCLVCIDPCSANKPDYWISLWAMLAFESHLDLASCNKDWHYHQGNILEFFFIMFMHLEDTFIQSNLH